MKVNREKKALTFGGLNMAGHNAPSNRRAEDLHGTPSMRV